MGQKLTGPLAAAEAERLLALALALLDETKHFAAAANVAQALEILDHVDVSDPAVTSADFGNLAAFRPSWGILVEK